jgi:signal transduction histidine kinase
MLGQAGRHAPDGSPVREEIREIAEVAQEALENVRGLSQSLHPSILEELGLASTVEWYLTTVRRQLGLTVHYERSPDLPQVSDTIGIHVYRVLQEALTNVAKHAGVTEAWVRLHATDGLLTLEVEDRGGGLTPAADRRGLGVVTMRERAALLGTLVQLVVPTGQAPASHAVS